MTHDITRAVAPKLHLIRGRLIILDSDLASLFGVPTKRLNEQIRRNRVRFPEDFAFRLEPQEVESLRSQIATSKKGRGGRHYLPFAITEHGVVMASNVLNSPSAVAMSVEIVRAFVRYRRIAHIGRSLRLKLKQIESSVLQRLDAHDTDIARLFQIVEALIEEHPGQAEEDHRLQ